MCRSDMHLQYLACFDSDYEPEGRPFESVRAHHYFERFIGFTEYRTRSKPRLVKILVGPSWRIRRIPQGAMMDFYHARWIPLGTSSRLCDGAGKSGVVAAERIPGGRKSNPQSSPAIPASVVGFGAIHFGGDRQAARAQSPEGHRVDR